MNINFNTNTNPFKGFLLSKNKFNSMKSFFQSVLILLFLLALQVTANSQGNAKQQSKSSDINTPKEQLQDMSSLQSKTTCNQSKQISGLNTQGYFDNIDFAKKNPEKVIRLNLQGSGLKSVPSNLSEFPNLQELDLANNKIKSISAGELPSNLKKLYINGNQITELSSVFSKLSKLQVLVAYDNPVTSIDASIGTLKSLKELWLSGNGNSVSFQPAIWNLQGLEVLRLWDFGITQIPDQIIDMQNLNTLCLKNNHLQTLNPNVVALHKLNYLNLGNNNLVALPYEIQHCEKLNYLGIYDNPINSLPDNFGILSKSLEWFAAWNTKLPVQTQTSLKKIFPTTNIAFESIDIH